MIKDVLENIKRKVAINPNQLAKNKKNITVWGSIVAVVVIGLISYKYFTSKSDETIDSDTVLISVAGDDFDAKDQKSALENQQMKIISLENSQKSEKLLRKSLENEIKLDNQKLLDAIQKLKEQQVLDQERYQAELLKYQSKRNDFVNDFNSKDKKGSQDSDSDDKQPINQNSISSYEPITLTSKVSIDYSHFDDEDFKKDYKSYIPAATYCRAVTISGADVKAGVNSSANPTPMEFRIVDDCILPQGRKNKSLKGALVLAGTYGDIGTERAYPRLESIAFYDLKTGEAFDIPVEGTVSDISGRNGIKGVPVLKNKKILQTAGISALLDKGGSAVEAASTTQSVGGGGVTSTVDSSQILANLAGGSISGVGKTLSNYYMKLAEAYSPIIEIRAGSVVNIIFQTGFPVKNKKAIKKYAQGANQARVNQDQPREIPNVLTQEYLNPRPPKKDDDLGNTNGMQNTIKQSVMNQTPNTGGNDFLV